MRTRIAQIASVALLAFAIGCAGDSGTEPEESELTGTFSLKTINGLTLPYSLRDDATTKILVTGGLVTLGLDGRFTDQMNYEITPAGGTLETFAETLTGRFFHDLELDALFFEVDIGGVYDFQVREDGTLVQFLEGFELVYGK